ncbi:hypothetical protein Htur_2684 [Haloterrigena turkmenica DSM 5511]|uniref:Uncharacterized protein n=1 Tax=Haloterrigena turkmenica (strain ATCC 51198 / DSM 5511 / JCM 9101 / NCIMB 13204 / VKM B-1734 / 4k) TaxID=543526 RepID=D2RWQ7_HALTV|nr:hypothetical protein [Haloterrigena turkmenica]ADB61558.1 hypothetical protein Htur_2684 [Haloterrigena turkmenica DSM 5511]
MPTPADSVRFESVTPRDVALIVLEELSLSDAFRSWLLEAIGLEIDIGTETESVTDLEARDSFGDVETANFDTARRRSASVLEVVLERGEQNERVDLVLTVATDFGSSADDDADALEGRRGDCRVVLLAPADSLEESATDTDPTIDATVPLEWLRDRLAARGTDRGAYRAALLASAIDGDRDSTGGPPSVVDAYRSLATEREPAFEFRAGSDLDRDLDLESSGEMTSEESTVAIDAPSLADDHLLVHALSAGSVELRIPGAAVHLRAFAARYATAIPPATDLLTDGDALVLRLSVPAIGSDSSEGDKALDGDATTIDEAAVDEALTAIRDLLTVSERVDERSS